MIVIRFSEGIMNVPASDFLLEPQVRKLTATEATAATMLIGVGR